jgi:hypothetical protein
MNAEQFISLGHALRDYALRSGHDLNASNLFAHTMLMRAINIEGDSDEPLTPQQRLEDEYRFRA